MARKHYFVPPHDDEATGYLRAKSGKTLGKAQDLMVQGLKSMITNFGGQERFALLIDKDRSLFSKYTTGQAALPEHVVAEWVHDLDLTPADAKVLLDAVALANASQRVLDLIPAWKTKAKALSDRLGRIGPRQAAGHKG